METRRNRSGNVALIVGGNAIVKFITIGGTCPEFGSMSLKEFYQEYNKVLTMEPVSAAFSFLKVAKRAFRHNHEVIEFLLEKIILKNMQEMSLAELIVVYNSLCVAAGKKPRKAFDSKKAALEAIEKLDATLQAPTQEQIISAEQSNQRSRKMSEVNEAGEVVAVEAKPRGKGIGARAMELLIAGMATADVIATIKSEIEGANPTPATIAWYKNKLRQEGKLPKPVKKDPAEKKPRAKKEKAAAVESDEQADVEDNA